MKELFWLIPNRLAGRPGPDLAPWDVSAMRTAGVSAVLSVNEGVMCRPHEFEANGIAYRCIPLAANAPPLPFDDELCIRALPRAYDFVHPHVSAGRATVVHCRSGKDRTGLFLAYYLMREAGIPPLEAIARVKAVRPIALSAPGWDDFALDVLTRCGSAE